MLSKVIRTAFKDMVFSPGMASILGIYANKITAVSD